MPTEIFRDRYQKGEALTGGDVIVYGDSAEAKFLADFRGRADFEARRIGRLLDLPDLTRRLDSPVKFIIDRILQTPEFAGFDDVTTPETIDPQTAFDIFNTPKDHPTRQPTDTYFLAPDKLLRTQTTAMWFYYLNDPEIRGRLEEQGSVKALSYGKVYRKDEIDRSHFPVFHQIDGLYLARRGDEVITLDTLKDALAALITAIFGPAIEYRFLDDSFPFTDPSTQIEIKHSDDWLEVVGGGLVHKNVLENLGLDPAVYNGWAFGFGLERLAMVKNEIPDIRLLWSDDPRIAGQFTSIDSRFKEVSKYPPITRDISFIVDQDTSLNSFYEIVRDHAGDLVEEVSLMDEYQNEAKLGATKKSYTFHIVFRSYERTLLNSEINELFKRIEAAVTAELKAVIR